MVNGMFLSSDPDVQNLKQQLATTVREHIELQVTNPAVSLIDTDFLAQDDLASLLIMNKAIRDLIKQDGLGKLDEFLANAVEGQEFNSLADLYNSWKNEKNDNHRLNIFRTIYISYVNQLVNSIAIEILSTSYLSANILTRALLEVLVNLVAKSNKKTMREKIESINFLQADEKETLLEVWKDLCGWVHSHSDWLQQLCPVLVERHGLHHPKFVRESIVYLAICMDFALVISIDFLSLSLKDLKTVLESYFIDYKRYQMINHRLSR